MSQNFMLNLNKVLLILNVYNLYVGLSTGSAILAILAALCIYLNFSAIRQLS